MADWDTSCKNWKERLLAGQPLVPDLPLFRAEADRALRVFKRLRVPDVIGKPTMGEIAGPWLLPIIEAIFGSYDPATHHRMIQEFFWLIPKKNSKTSTAAAVMVEALILNRRPEAEYVLVAPTKDVADRSFTQASGTIKADPELDKLFQISRHIRTIQHRRTGATLQVKAADTDVITGGKQVGTLIDELHVLASKKDADAIMVELRGALAARPDGFLITITTQSKDPPKGIFKAELAKARDVRDGLITMPILPILYELPPEMLADGGWQNRKLWPLINPNLGRSVNLTYLENQVQDAIREGEPKLSLIASQHFNVEIGLSLHRDRWAGANFWKKCAEPALTLDELLRRSDVAVVGIDGGGLDDLLGLCVMGRDKVTRQWLVWSHAWAHRLVLELRKEIANQLLDFEKQGNLTIVENDTNDDVVQVADIIERIQGAGLLAAEKAIAVDPSGISDIVDELVLRDFSVEKHMHGVRQGWSLTNKIKDCERRLARKDLIHSGMPLMDWCVGNAKTVQTGNALTITKQVSGTAKIDPLMAMFNAADVMATDPKAGGVVGTVDDFLRNPLAA